MKNSKIHSDDSREDAMRQLDVLLSVLRLSCEVEPVAAHEVAPICVLYASVAGYLRTVDEPHLHTTAREFLEFASEISRIPYVVFDDYVKVMVALHEYAISRRPKDASGRGDE